MATARATCLYCGAPLPAAPPSEPEAAAPAGPERALLVLDLRSVDPVTLASCLGLPAMEAARRARRGGFQLHRVAPVGDARAEAERLRAGGVAVTLVSERDATCAARPLVATGGGSSPDGLELRSSEGPIRVGRGELLLVVRGPIAREYQPGGRARRLRMATLEAGYRIHLHRAADVRPLELDPGAFDFGGAAVPASSLLQLSGWVSELAAGVTVDDDFRFQPPALGPEAPAESGPAAAAGSLAVGSSRRARDPESLVLDNLLQFRFYSGWRAAVERTSRS